MKEKRMIFHLLVFAVCLFVISCVFCEEEQIIQRSREYVIQHTSIPADIVNNMIVTPQYYPNVNEWSVSFRFFEFSRREFYVGIVQDEIVECDYNYKAQDDIQREFEYYYALNPSAQALPEWEKQYGPYPLWNVEENALFYAEYHHVPGETELMYEAGLLHYDMPSSNDMTLKEAREKADNILLNQFHIDKEELSTYLVGSVFYIYKQELYPVEIYDVSQYTSYIFEYYTKDYHEKLHHQYSVQLASPSGLCIGAIKHFPDDPNPEEKEAQEFPENYYSEIFMFIKNEYGYKRTDEKGAIDVSSVDPNMRLYYNPLGRDYLEGSFLYHVDRYCSMLKVEYTPLNSTFLYSQVNEEPFNKLKPCPWCEAPGR